MLTLALACIALVGGALGVALSLFVLARGSPAKLTAAMRECIDEIVTLRGEWTSQRTGVDAVLDSIHTERDNVQKANNRLSARSRNDVVQQAGPESRDDMLMRLRGSSGIGTPVS